MKLLFFTLFFFIPNALAQVVPVQKSVECISTSMLVQGLISSDYKEKPIWTGTEPGVTLSQYSLFVNEKTKSWTLIQFDEKISCVLGTGEASTQIFHGPEV